MSESASTSRVTPISGFPVADFFEVFDRCYDVIAAETVQRALAHPEFGPILGRMTAEQRAHELASGREQVRDAAAGRWEAFEAKLRRQGYRFAGLGLSFSGWTDIAGEVTRRCIPHLIGAYHGEPERLARALSAMLEYRDRRVTLMAEQYLESREARLRASEEQYKLFFEASPMPMWVFDVETLAILAVNDAAVHHYGWSREEFLGLTIKDIRPAEDVAAVLDDVSRLTADESYAQSWRHRKKDGSLIDVEISAHSFWFRGRKARLVLAHDVTQRKRADEARRKAETRFSRLAEAGIVGIISFDRGGVIGDANDACLAMLGYRHDELCAGALRWRDLIPPEWRDSDGRARAQLEERGLAPPWETELWRKDGSRAAVLVGVAPLEEGSSLAFMADLSGRKRAEQALRQTETQMRQMQKMEAIGSLAGGVAHDFNNSLSVIMSYAELMIADLPAGDPMKEDVDEIRKAARRAAELTRQLLLFSRQQVIEPAVLDLNEILRGMHKMLARIVGDDVELVSVYAADLGRVRADRGHVEQVIMNLVVNARDAMPRGGKLTIETADVQLDEAYAAQHLGVESGPHVMLAVSDTGSGMDAATQARIFEPFFTTKERGKGTGLGLSTVFGIIRQSNGSIWVYSEPGRGATFKVYLPRTEARAEPARPLPEPVSLRGHETILLVEDENQLRTVAKGILARHGYQVIEAASPGEAILACEAARQEIHLLLSDVVMPLMAGPELARRLAQARPQMRVLFMSGYTDDAVVRHGALESGIAFLQKPITPDALLRKVREVLGAHE